MTWLLMGLLGLVGLVSLTATLLIFQRERGRQSQIHRADLLAMVRREAEVQSSDIELALQALVREGQVGQRAEQPPPSPRLDERALFRMGTAGPELLSPQAPARTDPTKLASVPCLREARARAQSQDTEGAVRVYSTCNQESPAVRLSANAQAAALLTDSGAPERTLSLLMAADPSLLLPLGSAHRLGIDPRELLRLRAEAARALERAHRGPEATELLVSAVEEICTQPAQNLELLLPTAERIARTELTEPTIALSVLPCLAAASGRLARWELLVREVVPAAFLDRAAGRPTQSPVPLRPGPATEAVVDGYAFLKQADDGRLAVVTVARQGLIEALWSQVLYRANADSLALIDSQGLVISGTSPSSSTGGIAMEVPAGALLPDLRLVRWRGAEPEEALERNLLLAEALPLSAGMLLGALAITRRALADRHSRDLYDRQQAFITRVTHELKTPLAGIRIMAETIAMGAVEDKETNRIFISRIIQEADNLGRRIDEVLTAARRPEIRNLLPIQPEEITASLIQEWRPRFEQAGATLEADLQPCAAVKADPTLLRDALGNLLDNALKYGRTGTRGRVRVRTFEMGRWVAFEVTDNGIGVPTSMRKQIFERFTRVEGPGRGKAGGHGLGLAFVAEAAEVHGGLVECLDGFDGGARFRLKLRKAR